MLGKVLVTARFFSASSGPTSLLLRSNCEVVVHPATTGLSEETLAELCQDVDAIICGMEPITERVIASAPQLKVIARAGVGYNTIDVAAASRRGIPVGISPRTNDDSVAELTIGLIIALARNLIQAYEGVQQGQWQQVVGIELSKKTLSIIGLGAVGKSVARKARGLDMRVLAFDVAQDATFAKQHGVEYVTLSEALSEGDFVTLNAPLSPDTEKMINRRSIATMKRSAYLINVARGGLVDEEALADAVRSKRIAGAAVDVLGVEPPLKGSPLIGLPGVIVTPHMGAYTGEAIERMCLVAAQNVVAVLRGGTPLHSVEPATAIPHRARPDAVPR